MHILFDPLLMRSGSCLDLDTFTHKIPLLSVENLNCLCHYRWFRAGYTVAYVAGPRTGREETGKGTSLTPAPT